MIYDEKTKRTWLPGSAAVLFLAFAFFPGLLGLKELFADEGFYAAAADGVSGFPPLITAQGEMFAGGFPLYPLLVRGLSELGFSTEFSLRLIPFVSFAVLGGIVFLTCWRAMGANAAMAGVTAFFACILTADKFSEGNPAVLAALGVFATWMIWFDLGAWRGDWQLAWLCSAGTAGLTFYTVGWYGLVLIYFPMLFLRRPLTPWTKPRGFGFAGGVCLILLFLLLWGIPRWSGGAAFAVRDGWFHPPSFGKYLIHLATFPFDAALRYLPWTLFAWAPFCPALVQLDENPILSRYLRTIFLGEFCLLWLSPATESRDMIYLVPPLAVLIAMNYWIVVRRYGWTLLRIARWGGVLAFLLSLAALAFLYMPEDFLRRIFDPGRDLMYREEPFFLLLGFLAAGAGAIFAVAACLMARHGVRVWMTYLVLFMAFMLPFQGIVQPYRASERHREEMGTRLRAAMDVPAGSVTLYRMAQIPPFYCELQYFGAPVRTIVSASELPVSEPTVYVLSSVVPSAPERVWKRLFNENYRKTNLELWRGDSRLDEEDDE